MKILKYILIVIVLLAVVFFAMGFIKPEINYDAEIMVDKPIEEAWAVMNDESKITMWLKGITNIKHISGEKGKVGAVTEYTFSDNGQESTVLETITEIRPNEHVAMDFVMEGVMEMDYKMDLTEKDGKTLIKASTIAKGSGMLMRSIMSFMTSAMQAQEEENMSNLEKLINENTTDYFPAEVDMSGEEAEISVIN